MVVVSCLKRTDRKPSAYDYASHMRKCVLLLEMQANCVLDIIVTRDTGNLWIYRKEVVQVISYIGQENFLKQRITWITLFGRSGCQI